MRQLDYNLVVLARSFTGAPNDQVISYKFNFNNLENPVEVAWKFNVDNHYLSSFAVQSLS
jgi:hypothetical protein